MNVKKAVMLNFSLGSIWIPRIVLFVSLLLTAVAGYITKYNIDADERKDFGYACNELKKAISVRLSAHAQLLRSGSAFIMGSEKVTRKEWKRFVENEKIEKNLPGVQGVGFSEIIPKEHKLQHIEEIRKEGFPDYTIKPEGERDIYTSIIYLEPFSGRNLRAFGYDMFSEKTRRAAMEQARDSNVAMLSGKVMLVQETEKDVQAGTLMYVPVYNHDMPLTTVDERRCAIVGWVYSPYRMNDLMKGILGRWEIQKDISIHIHIYDGDSLSTAALLYDSRGNDTVKLKETLRQIIPLDFNGKRWTLDFVKNDDRSALLTPVIFVFAGGTLISLLIYFLIISYFNTRRKAQVLSESEKQYKYLSNQLEEIIDHIPGLVFYKDTKNNYIRVNKYLADGHGKEKSELEGKNLSDIYPKDDAAKYYEDDLAVINSGEARLNIEEPWSTIDGIKLVSSSKIPFIDTNGEIIGVIGMSMDITEQKKAEAVLLKAMMDAETANKAKSVFLANMSHEIRTPLNAIIGFSQLMTRGKLLSESQKEYSLSIIRAGEHLLALINDILELSKVEAGRITLRPENVDLHSFLKDMKMIFKERAASKNIYINFDSPDDIPGNVIVDESKLRQIFINIIGNAVKFTDKGGVDVHVEIVKRKDKAERLVVAVKDTGPGIDKNEINTLFQHFVQTSAGIKKGTGTGLGLVLSRELAVLMGGNITVQSKPGKGSVFTFEVDIQESHNLREQSVNIKRVIGIENEGKTYKVLVVDDKEENLKVVLSILKVAGFVTNGAANGEEALAKFREWKPDLILMDMLMPVMDGYEALRIIKLTREGKNTPVIALTASAFEEEKGRANMADLQGYIRKPFRENDLFSTIGKVLGIKYVYEDDNTAEYESLYIKDSFGEDIADVDVNILKQMSDAIDVADMDNLIKLIKKIEPVKPELSRHLLALAKDYGYDKLRLILRKKDKE